MTRALTIVLTVTLLAIASDARAASTVRAPATDPPATSTVPTPPPAPQAPAPPSSYADPLSALGAASPSCRGDVTAAARRNCRATGAIEHRYPLSSYGFDVQVGFSVAHLQDSFLGALQNIAALIWMALVYVVKAVMLLLEWAFSLDLLGAGMSDAKRTLDVLHTRVIGQPWFLAALSATALWGIWTGLVRRRTTETLGALAATVGLMLCALVILARPDDTVGYASRLANQASLGILAATTGHATDRPERALAGAMIDIFDATVRDPWCALEFGSVDYCHRSAKGSDKTNADIWLRYPAGSGERRTLYKLLKGDKLDTNSGVIDTLTSPITSAIGIGDGKDTTLPDDVKNSVAKEPARARMQEAGGTFPRFALLGVIGVGMTGTIALLAYLGLRLLVASLLALILLLLAPAMLLAPAFGYAGRDAFIKWAQRLAGALLTKLVYALFLAVVLAAAATIRAIDIGWFGTWLLQIAFWWGIFLKRNELIGFVAAGAPISNRHSAGDVLAKGYYAAQIARHAKAPAAALAAPAQGIATRTSQVFTDRRDARRTATASVAREQLDARAEAAVLARQQDALPIAQHATSARRELKALDRHLVGHDEARAAARALGHPEPAADEQQAAMLARRRQLQELLEEPTTRTAEHIVLRAHRSAAEHGAPVTPGDIAAHRQRRERERRLPPDDPRQLTAAGITPAQLAAADGPERAVLLDRVREEAAHEEQLARAAAGQRAEVRLDPRELRTRSAQERERIRRERRERRTRANVFRGT